VCVWGGGVAAADPPASLVCWPYRTWKGGAGHRRSVRMRTDRTRVGGGSGSTPLAQTGTPSLNPQVQAMVVFAEQGVKYRRRKHVERSDGLQLHTSSCTRLSWTCALLDPTSIAPNPFFVAYNGCILLLLKKWGHSPSCWGLWRRWC
jgi:hypothetical protein